MSRSSSGSSAYAAELARLSTAPATRELYRVQIDRLSAYCNDIGIDLYRLSSDHICRFLASIHQLTGGYAVVRMCVAAIGRLYQERGLANPTRHRAVRQLVHGLRRSTRIVESRPVLSQEMIRIVNTCGSDIRGLRDRALLLVAFAGPLRRCEVTALRTQDTVLTSEAILVLHPRTLIIQRGSETQTCPVAAVRAYLEATHIVSGPLWRGFNNRWEALPRALSYRSVSQILHDRARAAGVPDVSWPGVRLGFIDAAAKLPRFELQKRALISDPYELRRQLQRGRAQRRAASAATADHHATIRTEPHLVVKRPRKPLAITWQTVLQIRADLERLSSSQQGSRSTEAIRRSRPRATLRPQTFTKRRGSYQTRGYTQADVVQIRTELTRLYMTN